LIRDAFKIRPVAVGTISKCIWEIFRKCGLPKNELQPDHACRKYFNTVCINAGVNHTLKEVLLGHSVKLDDVYYDLTSENSLKKAIEEYTKALPELTITEDARTALSNELKLKDTPTLDALQKSLNSKDIEISELKQGFEAMKKTLMKFINESSGPRTPAESHKPNEPF
jgi:hypothetical protein